MRFSRRGLLLRFAVLPAVPFGWRSWREARDLVRGGAIGRVVFCRVSHSTRAAAVGWLRVVLGEAAPLGRRGPALRYRDFVAAYRQGRRELVICGTKATLVIDRQGCRRYA